ncbi:MAG: sensor histidine kinase [Methyloligellaceae bacterium]
MSAGHSRAMKMAGLLRRALRRLLGHPTLSELLVGAALVTAFWGLARHYDLFEVLVEWTRMYEKEEVDELILVAMATVLALAWFAYRRWREARSEIEKRTKIEMTLRKQNVDLARMNEELERFAFVASHDLQEPLRKIQTFSEYLEDDVKDGLTEDGHYALGVMRDAVQRMRLLISDLLNYSHVSHAALQIEPVDLSELLDTVVEDLSIQIHEAEAKVHVGPLPGVRCDRTQARQLFQNLLSNALKYRDRGRGCVVQVDAKAEQDRDGCQIFVKDNGIGFEPRFSQHIFLPFQRLHAQSKYEGSGVGLSICKRIAERHDWDLSAEGVPGEGATIVLTIPEFRAAKAAS